MQKLKFQFIYALFMLFKYIDSIVCIEKEN